MLSDKMQAALNDQINMELRAYYTYLSMSAYFQDSGLPGFAAWMFHHAEEEMTHAMKLYDYIHVRRGKVKLQAIPEPPHTWDSPLAAFEDAFEHERKVSISIDKLVSLAREEGDHATNSFLQWFVDEQVEEEEVVSNAIDKLKLVGDFGPGLYMLDKEMAADAAAGEGETEAEA
ncbi:MAG: ferritin [Phototrophicales bacterium]|nr:MAG: ferritin [Phototrophicales bacterium]RMG73982.1 MAG: ferritin [Chloroflexota bacterium]